MTGVRVGAARAGAASPQLALRSHSYRVELRMHHGISRLLTSNSVFKTFFFCRQIKGHKCLIFFGSDLWEWKSICSRHRQRKLVIVVHTLVVV